MAAFHDVRLVFVICCLIGVIVTAIVVPIVVTNNNNSSGGSDVESETSGCNYRTQSQGGWGTSCNGNNPGCYRDDHFCECFPQGVAIGCGPVGQWLKFTSSLAVNDFLPKGGSPSTITVRAKNPLSGDSGTDGSFAGNLLSAKLNVGFDACDPNFSSCSSNTSTLCFKNNVLPSGAYYCNGYTVAQVIVASDYIIGGCGPEMCTMVAPPKLCNLSPSTLSACLEVFNTNFDNGNTNLGKIGSCSSGYCKSS